MVLSKAKSKKGAAGDREVLILGIEGSGKTLLIRRLREALKTDYQQLARTKSGKKSPRNVVAVADDATFSTDVVPTVRAAHPRTPAAASAHLSSLPR